MSRAQSQTPRLSIVIPVHNGMPFLVDAVNSALSELSSDDELIVRDNCSTDGSTEWLDSISDPRIRILHADQLVPAAENWTLAIEQARGEFVKLLCADDEILPGGLSRQLQAISSNGAVMVASRRRVVNARGSTVLRSHGLGKSFFNVVPGAAALKQSILHGTNAFGEPASVLFRRDAVVAAGPFRTSAGYLVDIDFYARVLRQGTFVGLPSTDAVFRISDSSWSSEIGNAQYAQFIDWLDTLESEGQISLTDKERRLSRRRIWALFLARRIINQFASLARVRSTSPNQQKD